MTHPERTGQSGEFESRVRAAGQVEHPLERDLGPVLGLGVDLDHVDDLAVDEGLQRPHEVRQVDPVHRRAVADGLVEEHDLLLRVGVREPLAPG